MNNCVVVLGMHRSGTSAVAGVLAGMGVNFGPEEKLIGEDAEVNARGFWEHREIVMLNERLLIALGSSWDDIRDIDARHFESDEIHDIKESIKVILNRDFLGSTLWGIKDPRMCKLLPVWVDIFKDIRVVPRFIIVCRHPEEVARSLEKRDSISLEKAYALWLSYVLASELFSRDFLRTFVAYDSLLGDWRSIMEKAFNDLSLPFEDCLINSDEINEFLSPSLRHMVSERESMNGPGSLWVQAVYEGLLAYSDNANDIVAIKNGIDQIRKNFRIAMSLFAPMIFSQNSACAEIGDLRREQSILISDYEQCNKAYKQTKEAYKQAKEACEKTRTAYEQTRTAYEQTRTAYEQTRTAYEQTRTAYEQVRTELGSIKEKISWKICNKLGL